MHGLYRLLVSSFCLLILSSKGDDRMNPSLKDQLKEWKKQNREIKAAKKKKPRQKPLKAESEHLTELDIKSLMGMGQRGLRRGKGGAWK